MEAKSDVAEVTASPTNSTFSTTSTGRSSFHSHGRTMSIATDMGPPAKPNRFSVQFPVQLPEPRDFGRPPSSPTRTSAEATPDPSNSANVSGGNFLTAIAAQERKVLELKEELQKAEVELDKLKKQWAQHEAKKKLSDSKRLTQLDTLQTILPTVDKEHDEDGSSAWMHQEMERRKALLGGRKQRSRTVFSGSKHTRNLSLLSPTNDNTGAISKRALPNPKQITTRQSIDDSTRVDGPKAMARASTIPPFTNGMERTVSDQDNINDKAIDHEALIRTGKKMATDFKDGLWTFLEDLRQATVGEEATQRPAPKRQNSAQTLRAVKKQGSKNSLRPSSRGSSASRVSAKAKTPSPGRTPVPAPLPDLADPSFWTEYGAVPPQQTPISSRKKGPTSPQPPQSDSKAPSVASNDPWDTWDDSPQPSRTSSMASELATLPSTVSGSPRTSVNTNRYSRETPTKDALPWPALKKIGPATLRRTASHLMQEWENLERTLTPSPGQEFTGHEDYLGADIEAAAYDARGPRSAKRD